MTRLHQSERGSGKERRGHTPGDDISVGVIARLPPGRPPPLLVGLPHTTSTTSTTSTGTSSLTQRLGKARSPSRCRERRQLTPNLSPARRSGSSLGGKNKPAKWENGKSEPEERGKAQPSRVEGSTSTRPAGGGEKSRSIRSRLSLCPQTAETSPLLHLLGGDTLPGRADLSGRALARLHGGRRKRRSGGRTYGSAAVAGHGGASQDQPITPARSLPSE